MSFDKELFTEAVERLSEKRNKAEAVAEEQAVGEKGPDAPSHLIYQMW